MHQQHFRPALCASLRSPPSRSQSSVRTPYCFLAFRGAIILPRLFAYRLCPSLPLADVRASSTCAPSSPVDVHRPPSVRRSSCGLLCPQRFLTVRLHFPPSALHPPLPFTSYQPHPYPSGIRTQSAILLTHHAFIDTHTHLPFHHIRRCALVGAGRITPRTAHPSSPSALPGPTPAR